MTSRTREAPSMARVASETSRKKRSPSVPVPTKTRVAIDLSPQATEEVDELMALAQVPTRTALFRNALKLYRWILIQNRDGCEFIVRDPKKDEDRVIELFL